MNMTAAVVREQGVTFAVVLVKPSAMQTYNRDATQTSFARYFPGKPVVLCSQDGRGVPSYYGRRDLVDFCSNLLMGQLPWREFQPV